MTYQPGYGGAPHRQIAAALRQRIRPGEWAPGERLPSIPAIADRTASPSRPSSAPSTSCASRAC